MKPFFLFLGCLLLAYFAEAQSSVVFKKGRYYVTDSIIHKNSNLPALLNGLDTTQLRSSVKAKNISGVIRDFYKAITGEKLWLANKDAPYNCCCDKDDNLPDRQLLYFGVTDHMALLSYKHGLGPTATRMVLIFRLQGKRVVDFWAGDAWEPDETELMSRDAIIRYLRGHLDDREMSGDLENL